MNWKLLVTKPAQKALEKLPSHDQSKIESTLRAMEANPFAGDIKRLGPFGWRRRVGNYLVFYDFHVEEGEIVVTAIERRTTTTY